LAQVRIAHDHQGIPLLITQGIETIQMIKLKKPITIHVEPTKHPSRSSQFDGRRPVPVNARIVQTVTIEAADASGPCAKMSNNSGLNSPNGDDPAPVASRISAGTCRKTRNNAAVAAARMATQP
jgi:hypothetical protein